MKLPRDLNCLLEIVLKRARMGTEGTASVSNSTVLLDGGEILQVIGWKTLELWSLEG